MGKFSILWSESDERKSFADFDFVQALELDKLINFGAAKNVGEIEPQLSEFFTVNRETIIIRCDMFTELMNNPELYQGLKASFSSLSELYALKQEKEGKDSNEILLYSIKELEIYIDYLENISRLFREYPVKSLLLRSLKSKIDKLVNAEEYPQLCKEVEKQSHDIKYAKSVTIGVNLNAQMQPLEAGVVKINDSSYLSGNFIDKLLRLDFADNEFMCSAPLTSAQKGIPDAELSVLTWSLNNALSKILTPALKSWSRVVRKYVVDGLDDLFSVMYEWRFITICTDALLKIKAAGQTFCAPVFSDHDYVKGLYNPMLVMASDENDVVLNDLEFDENRIYILTGPNQGGKSIYTQAVGALYAMLHLGLPLPASNAEICLVDAILTHFIDNSKVSYQQGRLSSECEKIGNISKSISGNSLFLFDEALSSTSADEAVVISTEIISAYSEIGARGIWITHLHKLCELSEEKYMGKSRIGNLSAQLVEGSNERSFTIVKGAKYGKSYALDIAKKYHLTKNEILHTVGKI